MNDYQFFSQSGQDNFIAKDLFNFKKNGIFLDIGANDGITYSNSYFFEKYLNWNGVCVEPHPNAFQKLLLNRKSILVNKCLSNTDEPIDFLSIDGYAEMLSGVLSKYDSRHIQRIENEIKEYGGASKLIKVESITLEKLLQLNQISKIDYCSIDTEGGEFEILLQFDFGKIEVKCFSIENNYESEIIRRYMEDNGYRFVKKLDADEIYFKKSRKMFFWW